jgi:hypothetical protein
MRYRLGIVLALTAAFTAEAARAPRLILPLVQAQCPGPAPCSPAFAFRTGMAQLTAAKEPAPTAEDRQASGHGRRRSADRRDEGGAAYHRAARRRVTNLTTFGSDGVTVR